MQNLIDKEVLYKLYIQDLKPIRFIANKLKCGEATVLNYLKRYEIPRRPQHQWKGRKMSEVSKEKLRIAHTGKKASQETKDKMSAQRKGRTYSRPKRIKNSKGYTMLWEPNNPMSNKGGYIAEHRKVMAIILDRLLTGDEIIHHINEIKDDNRVENLMVLSRKLHGTHHESRPEKKKWQREMMRKIRRDRFWSTKKKVG